MVYMDDIIIYSKNAEEHKKHVKMVLSRLKEAKLILNKEKYEFNKSKISISNHLINLDSINIDPNRVKAILEPKPPPTNKEFESIFRNGQLM